MRSRYMEQLIERAERDDGFREQLVRDPKAAIRAELGIDIPDTLSVRVIEESPDEVAFVLPTKVQPGAISDEELAGVAGGTGGSWCGATHCGSSPSGCGCPTSM